MGDPTGTQIKTARDSLWRLALTRSTRNSSVRPFSMVNDSVVFVLAVKVCPLGVAVVMVNWPLASTTLPPTSVSDQPVLTLSSKLSSTRAKPVVPPKRQAIDKRVGMRGLKTAVFITIQGGCVV